MKPANILKIDTLGEGWSDKDNVMLHACFQLLIDYLEKEELEEQTDWNQSEEYAEANKEIDILQNWWKQRILDAEEGKINPVLNQSQYEKDNEMLIRLIKIRQYLWT